MSEKEITEKVLSDFLAAARVAGTHGRVFTVGPYGNRVGFAFQQTRAFALAAAFHNWFELNKRTVEKSRPKIAVLGGGISGITLTAALHSLGFSNLELLERKAGVLLDQAYASHRLVHPGYNTWPIVDEFTSTTRFPFLNWFAGPSDKVVSALRREWEGEWLDRLSEGAFRAGCHVRTVAFDETGDCVTVEYEHCLNGNETASFDYVFIALGFGIEKATSLSDSRAGRYWDVDTIQSVAEDHEKKLLLCIGDGDGALIDCARLAYRSNVFQIAASVMAALSSDAQRPPNQWEWRRTKTDTEQKICDAERKAAETGLSRDDSTKLLFEFYTGLVRSLSRKVRGILNDALVGNDGFFRNRQIHLVGRSPFPFLPGTAPINKLIMAHLIAEGAVIYHRGELVGGERDDKFRLDLCDLEGPKFEDFDYCVVRIGAEPPIETMFENFKPEHKSELTFQLNDFPPGAIDPNIFLDSFDLDSRSKKTPGTAQNAEFKKRHIAQFLQTYCRTKSGSSTQIYEVKKCDSGDPGRSQIVVLKHEYLENAANLLGGYDWHLFGIPLVSEDVNKNRDRENVNISAAF